MRRFIRWMKHKSTTIHQSPNNSQNSGRKLIVQHQRKQSQFHEQVKSLFWNARSVLYIDYLKKDAIVTGDYYSNLLSKLNKGRHEKNPVCRRQKNIFHQDNAPTHKGVEPMGWEN